MREFTHTIDLKYKVAENATVQGFVHALRVQSKIIFLILRDITGTVQVVIGAESSEFEKAKGLTLESVVRITGKVVEAKQAPGGCELQIELLEILSSATPELPIPVVTLKGGEETEAPRRFDYRWIDLRKPEHAQIFKVWTELEKGFRKYWLENNFIQLYPPAFMSTASETGAEVFEVKYFERKAYLAQSPQFYKQMGIASGLEKVFMVGPVFRAELSTTTRHLTEFTGWDFEIAYVDSHHDVMDEEEGMLVEGFKAVLDKLPETKIEIPTRPFPRITMLDAKKILAKRGVASGEEHDLSPEEERGLSEYVKEEFKHDFVFLTEYHHSKSFFYHMRVSPDSQYYRRADLLYRGIEVTTLAQREHRPEVLEKQARERGMDIEPLKDYLNFFRYGCPPHGGAGIGPARLVMKMLGLSNVREATYLPRDIKRLNP
ncbi:MAG TPA: aspartate--tRNA(Asn) ligase [Candidatus Paceibacterota bacterium]